MSMQKDTIEKLQAQGIAIANLTEKADYPAVVLPNDCGIHSMEKFMRYRNRFAAKMVTNNIDSFAKYVATFNANTAAGFVSPGDMSAQVVFNVGTIDEPGHADNIAQLDLCRTAAYSAFLSHTNGRHSQQHMAEFIEDWRDHITMTDENGDSIDVMKGLRAIRLTKVDANKQDVYGTQHFSVNKSALEQLDITGGDNLPLPSYINFTCEPYRGLADRTFSTRLSVSFGEKEILFNMNKLLHEKHREEMLEEFKKSVTELVGAGIPVYIGEFSV